MIALIDYGAGNLRSVQKALVHLGAQVRLAQTPDEVRGAAGVVLPGVGAFDDCMNAMRRQSLEAALVGAIRDGLPFLGICVGYQALFERSEEFQSCAPGLRLFQGPVVRFPTQAGLKVPQIGWNQVELTRTDCPLFEGVPSGTHFYFVHSYFPQPADASIVVGRTDYGVDFASAVWHQNVFATQFHPEKSQEAGLTLLRNFVAMAK